MERREDIRAAMQSLLSPIRQADPRAPSLPARTDPPAERFVEARVSPVGSGLPAHLLEASPPILAELQHTLREHGIVAELSEIARILADGLAARPALCRGLLAAYLLNEK